MRLRKLLRRPKPSASQTTATSPSDNSGSSNTNSPAGQRTLTRCSSVLAVIALAFFAGGSGSGTSTAPAAGGAADADTASAAEQRWTLQDLADATDGLWATWIDVGERIDRLEQLIGEAGLDLAALLPDRQRPGIGGPFVAADDRVAAGASDVLEVKGQLARWDTLRGLVDGLPTAAPLHRYTVRSQFGPRRDPLNRRRAIHTGVDLDAPYQTPVLATAGGVVSYAGWRNGYGRVVEVTHGPRVKTMFAHLAAATVDEGQRVDRGQMVGLLGSTGRTTGAHLHYEVLVDSIPRDPMTFIRMGQTVEDGTKGTGQASKPPKRVTRRAR